MFTGIITDLGRVRTISTGPLAARRIAASSIVRIVAPRRGWRTTLLPLDQSGVVSPDRLREVITDDTALVSVMHANNEIGTIQPIAELAAIAHEHIGA